MDERDLNRPIDDEHEAMLKTMLLLPEEESIPDDVVELYWNISRLARRIGHPVTPDILVLAVALKGHMPKPKPISFNDELEKGNVQYNNRIIAKFRNKWRIGHFIGTRDDKILAILDDDNAEERAFAPTSIRLPSQEDLVAIGE